MKKRHIVLLAIAASLLLAVVFRGALMRFAVGLAAGGAGYEVRYGELRAGRDGIDIRDLDVRFRGEPLLSAQRARIGMHWPGIFAGARSLYGLTGIALDRPRLAIVRDPDGSWNLPLHSGGGAPSGQAPAFALTASIRGGEVTLDDAMHGAFHPVARVSNIDADATIDTATRSVYSLRGDIDGGSEVRLDGFARARNAVSRAHVRAAAVPIAELMSIFVNPASVRFGGGIVRNVDAYAYAHKGGSYHLAGSAHVADLAIAIPSLRAPIRISGDLAVVDGGFASRDILAVAAGIALHGAGVLYGIPAQPSFAIAAAGNGSLAQAKSLFQFSKALPIAGGADVRVSLGGAIADPIVLASVAASRASYARAELDRVRCTVAYHDQSVTIVSASAAYETLALRGQAGLDTGTGGGSDSFAASMRGDAAVVPYLGHIVGTGEVRADAVASGPAGAITGSGSFSARGSHGSIAAAPVRFTFAGGMTAPIVATQPGGGSLDGLVHRDPDGALSIWADARNFRLEGSRAIDLGDSGRVAGRIDGTVGLAGSPRSFELAGRARVADATIGTLALSSASSRFRGTAHGTRFEGLEGTGPFGRFTGAGELVGYRLALDGRYDGSFEALRTLTGELGGRGALHGPVRIALSPAGTTVQTPGLNARGSSVRGIPLGTLAGTLALRDGALEVRQAVGGIAGGNAVVRGTAAALSVFATGVRARDLRAAGLPLNAGVVALAGTARVSDRMPAFDGSVVVRGGDYRGVPVAGVSSIALSGSAVRFDASGVVGGARSRAAGSAGGPAGAAAVDLATLGLPAGVLRAAGVKVPAELDAPLDFEGRIGLRGGRFTARGRAAIPVGFYGALPFTAAGADVNLDPAGVSLSNGSIAVGSTRVAFAGAAGFGSRRLSASARAPRVDLGDFDLYFARAGTLAGLGSAAFGLQRQGPAWQTSGDVHVDDATIGRPAGDITLHWGMHDAHTVAGTAGLVSGVNGLYADFRITPAGDAPALSPLEGALVSATLRAKDDNLLRDATLVIPPGFPSLSGQLSATGVLEGRVPDLTLAGTGTVQAGAIGRFPFEQASLSVSADRRGATITDAQLHVRSATAAGSGYVRFGARPYGEFRARAEVPEIHDILTTLANRPVPLFGSLEATATLRGTASHPQIDGAAFMPGGSFEGVTISRAVASFGISGSDVELRDATITFPKGGVQLAGTLPIRINPLRVGPRSAPIGFDLAARKLDLSDFAPLLPTGSQLSGTIEGRVGVNGTVRDPQLYGALVLSGGSVTAPAVLSDPITAIEGAATFAGRGMTLDRLSARAGSGTLNAAATAEVRSGEAAVRAQVRADHAVLGTPVAGKGTVDADLAFEKLPGQIASLAGTIALEDATIPFSALYVPSATSGGPVLPGLALDVKASAGKNVRVRSANVDIGGSGTLALGGTLAAPTLDGTLTSTGGTITFGNRAFRLQEGAVAFVPSAGFDADVTAQAVTRVPNSDPDPSRNPTGSATVTLTVTGSLSNPTTTLTSDPPYSKDQILGLLLGVPALGASLFSDTTPGIPGSRQYAAGGNFVGQEALGVLNAQFTRLLLAPFETQLSGALGLSSVDINIGGTSAVGVSARKVLGKDVSAIYSSSFIYPFRQSIGFELRARRYTSAQFLYYQTLAPVLGSSCSLVSPFENQGSAAAANDFNCSTQGFTLSLKQYFPPP